MGYCIVANVVDSGETALRIGARVTVKWLVGGGVERGRVFVSGLSKGGRRIRVWTQIRRLRDIRSAWAPTDEGDIYATREAAEADCADLIAHANRTGTYKDRCATT